MNDASTTIEQLRAIAAAWLNPQILRFQRTAMQSRSESIRQGLLGGSTHVFVMGRTCRQAAGEIFPELWAALVPYLDRTHFAWNTATLQSLEEMVLRLADEAAQALIAPMREVQNPPDLAAAELHSVSDWVEQQRAALQAKLRIYVADRRRREIIAALAELESRATAADLIEALQVIRVAKREAEKPAPDEGKLRKLLDSVTQVNNAAQAVGELGVRVQELVSWLAGY